MELSFILKKVISIMIMPYSIGLILLLLGIILLYNNKIKFSKIFLTIGVLWLSLFAYAPFSNALLNPLESKYQTIKELPKDVKYILLLGGDRFGRTWEALRLYHAIDNSKIITTGYKGSGDIAQAILTSIQLQEVGVPKKDIIVFDSPKDTKEEAIVIKKFLGKEKFILVTSAFHMPRAIAIFEGEGLSPIASNALYLKHPNPKLASMPNVVSLQNSTTAWHEYIGIIWGKLRGQF